MANGVSAKRKKALKSLIKRYESGDIDAEAFAREMKEFQAQASSLIKGGYYTQGANLRSIMESAGYDWKTGTVGEGVVVGPGETEGPGAGDTGTIETDEGLDLPDRELVDILSSPGGANILGAMTLEEAIEGREEGVATMEERLAGFQEDPLVQQLGETALGALQEPLFGEDDLASMLAAGDARLSQAYQNQSSALSAALGGRGLDPRSGISKGLAARNRFNVLQQSALNRIGTEMDVTRMNRAALQDAMRLGLATSSFGQGVQNQFASNIANLQAGQRLAGIGPELMGMNIAQNLDLEPESNPLAGIIPGATSGAAAGAPLGPYGMAGGAIVGGLGGYLANR